MVELLIALILLCVLVYAVYTVLGMVNLPAPIKTLVYLLIFVIVLFFVLDRAGIYHWS